MDKATFRLLEEFEGKEELRLVPGSYRGFTGLQKLKIGVELGTLIVGEDIPDRITVSVFQGAFGAGAGDPRLQRQDGLGRGRKHRFFQAAAFHLGGCRGQQSRSL